MWRRGAAAFKAAKSLPLAGLLLPALLWPMMLDAQSAAPPEAPAGSVGGLGDINLFPKRVVLDGRARVASIGLYNKTTNPGDYDITVTDKAMTEDGQLVDLATVSDPAARARIKTASAFLRWSPRKVRLRGSEAQTVRVMARIAPDLAPGEYRSHFSVVAVPPGTEGGISIEQAARGEQQSGIGVRILPRFGISIPVIVRVGTTTLTVGLKDFELVSMPGGGVAARFTITREGTRSAFGNIAISAAGAKKPLAEMKGIGVYTEIGQRRVTMPLDAAASATPLRSGTRLNVTYLDDDFTPGKILARLEFSVP